MKKNIIKGKTDTEILDELLKELKWLTQNSIGVLGLDINGRTLSWDKVKDLYLPFFDNLTEL